MPNSSAEHTIVCTGCGRPIPERADFCPHCTAPVGPNVWLDPFKRIFAEGYVNRNLTSGRPRKWVMACMFVLVVLWLLLWIFLAVQNGLSADSFQEERIASLIIFPLFIALGLLFATRIALNYRRLYGKDRQTPDAP